MARLMRITQYSTKEKRHYSTGSRDTQSSRFHVPQVSFSVAEGVLSSSSN